MKDPQKARETECLPNADEKRWRGVFEQAPAAMLLFDEQMHIVEANAEVCALLMTTQEELAGKRLGELFSCDEAGQMSFTTPNQFRAERCVRLRRRDGTVRSVYVRVTADALPGLHLCCCAEVTELLELRREMERRNRLEAIGRVAGGVVHDFNNMLTAIMSFNDLQLQSSQSGSVIRKYAASIQAAAERAAEITRQLLTFCRGEETTFVSLDLNDVLRESAVLVQRLIGEQVRLELELAPELPSIFADKTQLTQVLLNLAVNARDAMPEGGRLRIETVVAPEAQPGHIILRVQDSGTGIGADTLPHIFDPFFTTKAIGKGTGLGLSTVRRIVRQNRGDIAVKSEPGHGTTFQITLPGYREAARELDA